jgi:hypothetical protein
MNVPERETMAQAIVDGNSYLTLATAAAAGGRRRRGRDERLPVVLE